MYQLPKAFCGIFATLTDSTTLIENGYFYVYQLYLEHLIALHVDLKVHTCFYSESRDKLPFEHGLLQALI